MGETVVVRVADPADPAEIDAAVRLWTNSHVVRRNGRPLPVAHIALARQRMAGPEALLLLAEDPTPGDPNPGDPNPGDLNPGDPNPGSLIGTVLGVQGLDRDGAGPPLPGLLHLSLLSVAPDRWGQHVGRLLVEESLSRAPARGFDRVQLWTHADNLRANRLYKAMGFRRSGRVRVDDWGELLVHYRKSLLTPPAPPA